MVPWSFGINKCKNVQMRDSNPWSDATLLIMNIHNFCTIIPGPSSERMHRNRSSPLWRCTQDFICWLPAIWHPRWRPNSLQAMHRWLLLVMKTWRLCWWHRHYTRSLVTSRRPWKVLNSHPGSETKVSAWAKENKPDWCSSKSFVFHHQGPCFNSIDSHGCMCTWFTDPYSLLCIFTRNFNFLLLWKSCLNLVIKNPPHPWKLGSC